MSAPGWHPDPTGRFAARWFDGADWTDQVLGANGQATTDALPRTSTGLPAPGGAAAPPVGAAPAWGAAPVAPPAWGAPAPTWSSAPSSAASGERPRSAGVGILVSFLGALLVILSLFALDWADGGGTFSKLRDGYSKVSSGLPAEDQVVKAYTQFGAYLLLAIVLGGLVLVAVGALGHGRGGLRTLVALVAGIGAIWHLYVVQRVFRGPGDPEIGAQVAIVGYLLAIVGLAFGPKRARR